MKKLFVLLLTVVLCALLFASCGTPKTADELMAKIDKKMDSLKSYHADMTANFSTELNGFQCSADFSGQVIEIHGNAGKYYSYDMMEGKTEIKDKEKNEVIESVDMKSLQAFHEGKMFVLMEQDNLTQKLYSSLGKDEYIAYIEKQNDALDIDFEACVNSSFEKNEDNSWTLKYSGYTKKAIDEFIELFGADDLFEEEIEDMEITIHANADFTVKDMEIKLVFENESTASDFRMTAQYSKYNKALPVVDDLNEADYHEIADCRLLTDIKDMLEDIEELENGSFVLDLNQSLKVGNSKNTSSEKDTVKYGKKDGKYFYNITADYNNGKVDISYENGKQTVTVSGVTETVDQTEKEAKEFISGLINTVKYDPTRVSDITKTEDGVYKIRFDHPDESLYQPIFASIGTPDSVSQTITVTVQDGKITKMESELTASDFTMMYGNVTFNLTSKIEFQY